MIIRKNALLALSMLMICMDLHGRSLTLTAGYQSQQQSYLTEVSSLQEAYLGIAVDLQHWRITSQGWFARGPKLTFIQSPLMLRAQLDLPLFQFNKHQGLWLASRYQQAQLSTIADNSHIFLGNNGQSTAITANDEVLSQHQLQTYKMYWYESSLHIGAVNQIGLLYHHETSPAASTISNTNADWFDGTWTGWGLWLGRARDFQGVNFQWHVTLAQLDSTFSPSVTNNAGLSKNESQGYGLTIQANWHYRYYLAPYWYLVPSAGIQNRVFFQKERDPQQIKHDPYQQIELHTAIQLQKRF